MVRAILSLACSLLFVLMVSEVKSAVPGAEYYVSESGNDLGPGSITAPFRTIGKGTSVLQSGDTLYLRGGTYNENIGSNDIPAGSSVQSTVIAGYQNENPTIRCSAGNCGNFETVITLFNSYITLRDFTIDVINGGVGGMCAYLPANALFLRMTCLNAPRDAIRVVGENTTIRDSHIKDCGRIQEPIPAQVDTKGVGVHANSDGASNTSNLLIEGNLIEGCRAGGIGVQQSGDTHNVIVRNNILRNFGTQSTWPQQAGAVPQSGTGINFGHGSNYYAYNNLIYRVTGPGSDCFLTWGGGLGRPHGSFFYIYNNTCHDTETGILMWDQSNNVTAQNNIFSNVGTVSILGTGANNSNSNFVTNAVFVDSAAGDFRLTAGSPGIDEGVNLSLIFTTDIVGVSRGSSFDIGAYEFTAGTSSSTLAAVGKIPARFPISATVGSAPGNTTDWVGRFASGAPGASPDEWQYLNGTQTPPTTAILNTTLQFTAPVASGNYEFRLYRNDSVQIGDLMATAPFHAFAGRLVVGSGNLLKVDAANTVQVEGGS